MHFAQRQGGSVCRVKGPAKETRPGSETRASERNALAPNPDPKKCTLSLKPVPKKHTLSLYSKSVKEICHSPKTRAKNLKRPVKEAQLGSEITHFCP